MILHVPKHVIFLVGLLQQLLQMKFYNFELEELKSSSIDMKSVSWPPEGPSSYIGLLPLSCTCTCDADDGNETPSTPGGDSTRQAASNNTLVPL